MRILVIQDHLRSGGTERQSILLARGFAAAGHAAELLTFRPGGRLASSAQGLAWRVLQPFDSGIDGWAPGLSRALERFRPDIILCMGKTANAYLPWIQGRLRRRALPTAVVATLRSGYRLRPLYARALRRARLVVVNSRGAAEQLAATLGLARERIAVVHNSLVFPESPPPALDGAREGHESGGLSAGSSLQPCSPEPVSPEASSPSPFSAPPRKLSEPASPDQPSVRCDLGREATGEIRARFGAGPGTSVLLSVAMFRPEKNQRFLIEMAGGLPSGLDWQLWLVGDGPARTPCERLVRSRGLSARIRFVAFQADPGPWYGAADIAVHASREESLSNFLIEAQVHGLPVVAAQALGVDECFVPGRTGWIIPQGDGPAFRAAVEGLAKALPAERIARSAEARAFARAAFDPERQVAAYLELFQTLLASP